jgi:hypothetical protein
MLARHAQAVGFMLDGFDGHARGDPAQDRNLNAVFLNRFLAAAKGR